MLGKKGDQVVLLALIKGYNELVSKIHIRHFSFSDSICLLSSLHASQNCTMACRCSRILDNDAWFLSSLPKRFSRNNLKTEHQDVISELVLHLCLNRGPLSASEQMPDLQHNPYILPSKSSDRGLPFERF